MRTIRSSREIDEVFREGIRVARPAGTVLIRKTERRRGSAGRVAFVAGKRSGNAVRRNRSKRVLREAVRRAGGPWPGFDVVVIAQPRTASATVEEADDLMDAAVKAMGARNGPRT